MLHHKLGDVLVKLGDYEKAIAAYEIALDLRQGYGPGQVHYAMGIAYQKAGSFEKAISEFTQAKATGGAAALCDYGIDECKRGERGRD